MPKLTSMNIPQLKQLLTEHGLSATGNKAELVTRLTEAMGTDECEVPTDPNNDLQRQIDELKHMLADAMSLLANARVETVSRPSTEMTRDATDGSGGSNASRYTVKEIAETIPVFDPLDDSSLTVDQFISSVNRASVAYSWDDRRLLLAVYSRCKGVAKSWVDSLPHLSTSWTDFAQRLRAEFGHDPDEAEINFSMRNAVRGNDEGVVAYCFRMSALGLRFNLSEAAIVRYAREGLRHRELQAALATSRFSTMKEFRETCVNDLATANTTSRSGHAKTTLLTDASK